MYVLEGTAPALKYGIICERNKNTQFIGARPKKPTQLTQSQNS